jgi:hypothetical protein
LIAELKRLLVSMMHILLIGLMAMGLWYYLTVYIIQYGPFEVQVVTAEPMEDIVLVLGYEHGPSFGLRDDIYREERVVSSGEWVKFPAGVFQYFGKPNMSVSLHHPELSSTTLGVLSLSDKKQWDGGEIKFPPVKARLWQGDSIRGHLMRMNDSYLTHFSGSERKKLRKYISVLEHQIESVSNTDDERMVSIARYELEQFKTKIQ